MAWDTTLIDGTDLATIAGISGDPYGSVFEVMSPRGDLPTFPGVDGMPDLTDRPAAAKLVTYDLTMRGSSLTKQNDSWRALQALCKPYKQVTLTRRVSLTAGNESHTSEAILQRMVPAYQGPYVTRAVVEFLLLRGMWFGASTNIASASGVVAVLGTARTERMTITLSAGATSPVVTNGANGFSLTYAAAVPSDGVVIDVEARTAINPVPSGDVDVSKNLSWNKRAPFRLEPGNNALTTSSGTASIDYQPAYL